MPGRNSVDLTYEERKTIELLSSKGKTFGFIAKVLDRAHSTVKAEVRKNGGKANYSSELAEKAYQLRQTHKINKLKKHFSDEQIAFITQGISDGKSAHELAQKLGITEYRIIKYIRENHKGYVPKNYLKFEARICALEFQIEILNQMLRELYDKNPKHD